MYQYKAASIIATQAIDVYLQKTIRRSVICRLFWSIPFNICDLPFTCYSIHKKLTEYLCSAGWFFSPDKLRLLNLTKFLISFKRYCCPELKIKKRVIWLTLKKQWGFEVLPVCQIRAVFCTFSRIAFFEILKFLQNLSLGKLCNLRKIPRSGCSLLYGLWSKFVWKLI